MNNFKLVELVGKMNGVTGWYSFRYGKSETEYDNIPPTFFLSADEIVTDLINRLPGEDIDNIQKRSQEDLISLHFGFGMWIRNTYGMWHESNPHINVTDCNSDFHPDQYSFSVIEQLHKKLNIGANHTKAYEEAMKILK